MSMRLNEEPLMGEVFRAVPPLDIQLVVREMPQPYLQRFLRFVAKHFETSPHLEFHLLWYVLVCARVCAPCEYLHTNARCLSQPIVAHFEV